MQINRLTLLSIISALALLLSACGSAAEKDSISTAVAQTVAAQNTKQAGFTPTLPPPTNTPATPLFPTLTATKLPPTLPYAGGKSACAQASWTGDEPPDGTIYKPGESFWKTWHIQNTSTCTWNTSYQIIFWNGDLMGGATYYNFPQTVFPGQIVDVPLLLTAPTDDGTYESEWMFKTPDGIVFGVGEYSVPITAKIQVSSALKPEYGITDIQFKTVRVPEYGCEKVNILYTVYATISTSGPLEIWYYWAQQDGNDSAQKMIEMKEAGSITLERAWRFHLGTTVGQKWIQLIITAPGEKAYPKQIFYNNCGQP
jgi:hypothetical protein